MIEQPSPELFTNKNNVNADSISGTETEKRAAFEELLINVRRDLDTLTPFAIEVLNPFPSIEELEEFSKKYGQGANKTVYFMEVEGGGEDVQGAYIQSFIKRFFPKIEVATLNYLSVKVKRNAIKTIMSDFHELFKLKDPKVTGFEPPKKKDIVFSMVPTKILHSNPPNPEKVDKLRASFFQEFERICRESGITPQNLDAPLLVGDMAVFRSVNEETPLPWVAKIDISQLRNLGTSFRIISPIEGHILCGFYNAETDTYTEEARLPIASDLLLRALYTIGDFSVVRHNKNKMEGVVAGTRVITIGDFSDVSKNPNVVLDTMLRTMGYIVTIDEAAQIGLDRVERKSRLTEQDIRDLYINYMKSPDKVSFEPSLKESMQKLIDTIAAPSENLMTFIRNIFS